MAESRPEVQQVIEVPVVRDKRSGLNIGNILLVGGIGYVLFKTFLLEERVNDLTVLIKRQSSGTAMSHAKPIDTQPIHHADSDYETSDDDDDDAPECTAQREEKEEKEVGIEEQPREVPPHAEIPARPVAVATPSGSAFVTTRQRRTGSELRRDSSRAGASA